MKGVFLIHLKQAKVTPIFEKVDTEDLNNYRPISITAILMKVFEKVNHGKTTEYLENFTFMISSKFQFRRNFPTTHALLFMTKTRYR